MAALPLLRHHYDETALPPCGDSTLAAAQLLESGLFDTYVLYERGGQLSLALGTAAEITVDRAEVVLHTSETRHAVPWFAEPLDQVAELLESLAAMPWRAYGWVGFELAYAYAGLADLMGDETLLHLIVPQVEVRWYDDSVVVRGTDPATCRQVCEVLATPPRPRTYRSSPLDVEQDSVDDYRNAVAAAVREISDRQLQKVILSRIVPVDYSVDLVGSYIVGRRHNTPSRSFLLNVGGMQAAGFSPEVVAEVDSAGRVCTYPLAGTRALSGCHEEDRQLGIDLLGDSKEIFEHSIAVKAAWDELAALCQSRSVTVEDFMTIKRRGTVQHLASSVSGRLLAGQGPWQAFAALFPGVTACGFPKKAAYESIRRHESSPRGLYSGAVLTIDHTGAMDAALVLRTIFHQHGRTWLRAGAGIVEQSRPDREFEETCEKLRSVALHLVAAEGRH